MVKANVEMQVRKVNDQVGIVDVRGELTSFAENTLMDAYTQAGGESLSALILNLSELEYMNSSGIGLLVTLLIRMKRHKQRLLACGLSEHYQHIFELTRLNEAIGIHNTEAEALAAVG